MNRRGPIDVSLRAFWLGAGWLGVVLVAYLSLAPAPPTLAIEYGDLVQHVLAYAGLMAWFAQVYIRGTERWVMALALVAIGVALELAQGLTGYRFMSFADMAANTSGVALGLLAAPPRVPNGLAWLSSVTRR